MTLQDWIDDWKYRLREWRHSRCLMTPAVILVFVVIGCLLIGTLLLCVPTLLLALLMSWCLKDFFFVVEFLYATPLGRYLHISLAKAAMRQRSGSQQTLLQQQHSRTLELRIQVTERIYIHPLPQLTDNIGYLVVCLPPVSDENALDYVDGENMQSKRQQPPIVAFVVDCGDSDTVVQLVSAIVGRHYINQTIEVQAILSTHKHHDHTAGNVALREAMPSIQHVFGGAVERVPGCTFPLVNGDVLQLPRKGDNNMNDQVEVEAIATPGHTRGSLVYCLRSHDTTVLFTGDTLFSGANGGAFESDGDARQDNRRKKLTPTTFIQANSSVYAMERCFAEVMARCQRTNGRFPEISNDRIVMLPGHEYAAIVLSRQISSPSDSCQWQCFAPSFFLHTMSQLYVALHRRSLPPSTGNLLASLTTLRRELQINLTFRSLRRRGELVLRAIIFWHRNFSFIKVPEYSNSHGNSTVDQNPRGISGDRNTRPSSILQWNLDAYDIDRDVFTTVFTNDLSTLIQKLKSGQIEGQSAARRLEAMQRVLQSPPVGGRPVPGTLPSDRAIFKALVGLTVLGSGPAAMTLKDSREMKLPTPMVTSSDRIRISRSRLVTVLARLGLLDKTLDARQLTVMLRELWKEAKVHSLAVADGENRIKEHERPWSRQDPSDLESDSVPDEVDLGSLRWALYGSSKCAPGSVPRWCIPCSHPQTPPLEHPIDKATMQVNAGELVRHDHFSCPLCNSMTRPMMDNMGTTCPLSESGFALPDNDELTLIEVGPSFLDSLMREA